MKIEFKKKQDIQQEKTIYNVKDWLVIFLNNNGFIAAEDVMIVEGNKIVFQPSCSNSDMTKAIGLMLLLFTRNNEWLFFGFYKGGYMLIDVQYGGSWHKGYEYLESIGMGVDIKF